MENKKTGIYNLGSEQGYSVRQIAETARRVTKQDFKIISGERRPGDIAVSIASSDKAKKELRWNSLCNLEDILRSAWDWEQKHHQ
jgi:UDP-glucose 4-epimerase